MVSVQDHELVALLIAAGEAPPASRIEFRDPIAAFGDQAVERLSRPEWIGDPLYAAFAIRTISRAGKLGAPTAVRELRRALEFVANETLRRDIEFELAALGASLGVKKANTKHSKVVTAPISVDDLRVGACYRRRDLHLGGLGGNWQKGISYPADGTHCLLFSDPSKASEYGYRDEPFGADGYRYFGEWDGPGDMTMSGGNQRIVDRSPELYLFTDASCGRVFRGRFEFESWGWETTTRDGKELKAIVFTLRETH